MENRAHVIFPTMIALVLGGVAIFEGMPALESLRPQAEGAQATLREQAVSRLQPVAARLWQDPLPPVYDYDDEVPYACPTSIVNELRSLRGAEDEKIGILGVMLSGGHFVDDEENRLRSRRAIYAALSVAAYAPLDGRHLGVVKVPKLTRREGKVVAEDGDKSKHKIPFEIYVEDPVRGRGDGRPAYLDRVCGARPIVIVLWIDAEYTEQFPLHAYAEVLRPWHTVLKPTAPAAPDPGEAVPEPAPQPAWASIIGPADSGGYAGLLEDDRLSKGPVCEEHRKVLGQVRMYSPWSTLSEAHLETIVQGAQLRSKVTKQDTAAPEDRAKGRKALNCGMQIVRTIGTDDQLVELLLDELEERKVHVRRESKKRKSSIALLIEWDNAYGRGLFESTMGAVLEGRPLDGPAAVYLRDHVHLFGYSKGMDGLIATDKRVLSEYEWGRESPLSKEAKSKPKKRRQPSAGRGSLDYIRRTIDFMQRQDVTYRAIGIFGSDVYDKLVLLQALHSEFPSTIFFTTDLDARFTDASEYKTTRNLIVASHYGLRAGKHFQEGVPPFRGSYQTAMYISTLAAVGFVPGYMRTLRKKPVELAAAPHWWPMRTLEPRVYEIGRSGAFDLSPFRGDDGLHAKGREVQAFAAGFSSPRVFAVVLGIVILLLLWQTFRSRRQEGLPWGALTLAGTAVVLFCYVWFAVRPISSRGEPFAWFEGISAWPTTIFRVGIAGLCGYYLVSLFARLRECNKRITDRYFNENGQSDLVTDTRDDVRKWSTAEKKRRWWLPAVYLRTTATTWDWSERESPQAARIWGEYLGRNKGRYRAVRILVLALIFILFAAAVIAAGNLPTAPVRGGTSIFWYKATLIVAVLAVWILMATVLSTTALSLGLMRNVAPDGVRWPDAEKWEVRRALKVPTAVADKWLAIEMVGQSTGVIQRFVYYPFVAMLLMFVATSSAVDNFSLPTQVYFVQGVYIACVVAAALMIHRAGGQMRDQVIEELQEIKRKEPVLDSDLTWDENSGPKQVYVKEIDGLIKRIRDYKEGAFASIAGGPVVRALLIPGGGISLLLLMENLIRN